MSEFKLSPGRFTISSSGQWPPRLLLGLFLLPVAALTACRDPSEQLEIDSASALLEAFVGQETRTSLTVENTGKGSVTIESIEEAGGSAADDGQLTLVGASSLEGVQLKPGDSASLEVVFAPTRVGDASMTVAFHVKGSSAKEIGLAARGLNNLPVPAVATNAPTSVCRDLPFRISFTVDDVEDGTRLNTIAYSLDASLDGPVGGGYFTSEGAVAAALTLHQAGEQVITLSATDTDAGIGEVSHTLQVDASDSNADGIPDCQDQDRDGYSALGGDCDDSDPNISPAAVDICSGVDENCDGEVDPMPASDADEDGTSDCFDDDGDGFTERQKDCDDGNPSVYPGAVETCNAVDDDCDDTIDEGFDQDGDGQFPMDCTGGTDCNDISASIYQGAVEVCNEVDDDCDGVSDDGFDSDDDGFYQCTQGAKSADCNDEDPNISPGEEEICDGIDQDCDSVTDDGFDQDGDGFYLCAVENRPADCDDASETIYPDAVESCNRMDDDCDAEVDEDPTFDADSDGFTFCGGDCNDGDAAVHPDAAELCNQVDDDCDSDTDEGFDADSDGHFSTELCSFGDDCNDADAAIYAGAEEVCNGVDDNCNTRVDEGFDADGDLYLSAEHCPDGLDCDDDDGTVNPAAAELCDGKDNDCNEEVDETDNDDDGYGACDGEAQDCNDFDADIYPGASEVCNLLDDDCDDTVDEEFDADEDGYSTCAGDCRDDDGDVFPSIVDSGWVDYPCNPVLPVSAVSSEDSLYADQASVWIDAAAPLEQRYKAWYRYGKDAASTRIGYAESPDGIRWTKRGIVLSNGPAGAFDEGRLNYPTVLFHDGKYRMWYHGTNASGGNLQIGYATSADGVAWTRENSGQPVLPKGTAGSWDDRSTQAPTVVFNSDDAQYYMWYGGNSSTTSALQIGLATSPDGIAWSRGAAAVLPVGSQGEWDSYRVNFARVLDNGEFFEMRYSGSETGTIFEIGTATSSDGVTWDRGDQPVLSPVAGTWNAALVYSPMTLTSVDSEGRLLYSIWYSGGPTTAGPFQTGIATNYLPSVRVVAPFDESRFTTSDNISFQCFVTDPWHVETVNIVVESDLAGVIASGAVSESGFFSFQKQLAAGTHTLSFTAFDSGGLAAVDQISVVVSDLELP